MSTRPTCAVFLMCKEIDNSALVGDMFDEGSTNGRNTLSDKISLLAS